MVFEFLRHIFSCFRKQSKDEENIKSVNQLGQTHKRRPIPPEIRKSVWTKYHGENTEGFCYCCGIQIQRYNAGWHCSHVKADIKGGLPTVDNLRTCCRHCNLSMGDQNLYAYIRDHDLNGPGRSNINKYLKHHKSQINDKRTNNWRKCASPISNHKLTTKE